MHDLWIDLLQLKLSARSEDHLNEHLYGAIRDAILDRSASAGGGYRSLVNWQQDWVSLTTVADNDTPAFSTTATACIHYAFPPQGAVMSIQRRRQRLTYARQHRVMIVEDDYDSEFRYTSSPVPSLAGLEPDASVIYIGTFSKTVYPSLRVAYMVLPKSLAPCFQRAYLDVHRGGHSAMQLALSEFIESGEYAQHIRHMRGVYRRRRDALSAPVEARFGS